MTPRRTRHGRLCRSAICALVGALAVTPLAARQAASLPSPIAIDGAWIMTLDMPQGVATPHVTFTRKGDDLSGTYSGRYGDFPITGLVRGQVVTFTFVMGSDATPVTICFTGEWVAGNATLKGTATIGELGQATWTAARDPNPASQP
jgi:hypothetical protein